MLSADIKKDFQIFTHHPHLVYLDSTATSLKPDQVIRKLQDYYTKYSANIHRGIYAIAEQATSEYEQTRQIVAEFIGSKNPSEVVFTRNTTEALNLVAYSVGREVVGKNDEIVTSIMEHHSNFVPWQQLAFENEAVLKVLHITPEGRLDIDVQNLDKVITRRTKLVALTYVSNVLGTVNNLKEIIKAVKTISPRCVVVVDAAQAVPHMRVNVDDLGCDFLAFSAHKMLGPTGVGVLWGRYALLEQMDPFLYGGEMIAEVTLKETLFKKPPHKFEAGTPHIAGVIALSEAIAYLNTLGAHAIYEHEKELVSYASDALLGEFGKDMRILGPRDSAERTGILSFGFASFHPHDIAQILDEKGIAVRAGHHCAMPLHNALDMIASTRASFYVYNQKSDIDALIRGLKHVYAIFNK